MGGSALYFALAASLIMPVRMVGPVGQESLATVKEILGSRPIDIEYLDVLDAPTYRWRGRQESERNIDRGSQDSIYDRWKPRVPAGYQGWAFVGSMRPDRQALLTIELGHSSLLAADAMLSYLQSQPEEARDVLRHSHWYFCNHEEFAALGGHEPAEFRRRWSLDGLVVKAGPRGVTAYTELGSAHVPALPSQRVATPRGPATRSRRGPVHPGRMHCTWQGGGGWCCHHGWRHAACPIRHTRGQHVAGWPHKWSVVEVFNGRDVSHRPRKLRAYHRNPGCGHGHRGLSARRVRAHH